MFEFSVAHTLLHIVTEDNNFFSIMHLPLKTKKLTLTCSVSVNSRVNQTVVVLALFYQYSISASIWYALYFLGFRVYYCYVIRLLDTILSITLPFPVRSFFYRLRCCPGRFGLIRNCAAGLPSVGC